MDDELLRHDELVNIGGAFVASGILSTSNDFQLLRSGCCLKVDPLWIWWRFSTNPKKKNLLGKAWKRGGNHVYSCIDVTFLGQIFHYFQKPSCHSEVKLQRVLKRNLFLNPVSQEFLPPEKQERAVNKKKHVQNNANQQKFKLALHNNIVTSHDAHDSFWMTEATSESFARFTGRKNPSSAFVPSVGTNNFAFGRKKGGSILQYLIFTTHHQPYLFLLRIEVDMIKTMTVSFPCISISLPGDNIIPLYTLYCFNLIHTDSIFHIDIPG